MPSRRRLPAARPARSDQRHFRRSRRAARHHARAVQGRGRGQRAWRVPRHHRGPAERAEDRRAYAQQEPAAVAARRHRHQTRARYSGRRRQMRPRRDRGRSRRRGAVLSRKPRAAGARGAADADRRLRRRCARPGREPGSARFPRCSCATLAGGARIVSATRIQTTATPGFDPRRIKRDFPIFERNPGLVFLDSAASAQKPAAVIDRVSDFYRSDYANVHRGVYRLSARSSDLYEGARETAAKFLNAASADEIVFVRGATEAINLVAYSWGLNFLKPGDEVLVTELEHHANIVPWQLIRERTGLRLVAAPIDASGGLDLAGFEKKTLRQDQAGGGDASRQRHRRLAAGRGYHPPGAPRGRQ